MSSEIMDWDGAYREEGEFEGPPPWNIGLNSSRNSVLRCVVNMKGALPQR